MIVQVKLQDKWRTVEKGAYEGRNYPLFYLLAGVRGYGKPGPIAPPKGLPADFPMDADNKHHGFWMGEHSFSYLTLEEMEPHAEVPYEDDDSEGTIMDTVLKPKLRAHAKHFNVRPYSIRIVFGFDS